MIEPEPTYSYVKGEGWVPTCFYKMYDGTLVQIEYRKPKLGEYFCWDYIEDDGTTTEWDTWIVKRELGCFSKYHPSYDPWDKEKPVSWVTIIPVTP